MKYALAQRVNATVNAETRYCSDAELYGREEFWTIANGAGDCDDYALAKRRRLLDAGVDPKEVRLAVCFTETGEGHMVLIATTDRGDYVLDNRHPEPMARDDLGYTWLYMEQEGRWSTIAP